MNRRTSRYLALVLRHNPQKAGLVPDANGWVLVRDLLVGLKRSGHPTTEDELHAIVRENDKRRFTLSDDGLRIRAAQGHSIDVDLALEAAVPDGPLFHGTARSSLDSIFAGGIVPGRRRHVHLSSDVETAIKVGSRHGRPVVLRIDVTGMLSDGATFWKADNGVWLTDRVPPSRLGFAAGDPSKS